MAGGVRQWDSCPGNWAGGVGAHAKSKSDKSVCVCTYIYTYIDMVGSNEVYECALWLEGGKAELVA